MTKETNSNEYLGYRAHPAIANSDLKHLHDPISFKMNKMGQADQEDTKWQRTGTMIDYFLLDRPKFLKKYIQDPGFESPSSPNQQQFLAKLLLEDRSIEHIPDETLFKIHDSCYSKGDLDKAKDLAEKLRYMVEFKTNHGNKIIVSNNDWEMLKYIEKSCMNKKVINTLLFNTPNNLRVFKHLQVIGMPMHNIKWKGEIDFAAVDFENKIIYNIDLKSSSDNIESFNYTYINKYRYHRQQALYRKLLMWYLVTQNIIDEEELKAEWLIKTRCLMVRSVPYHQAYLIPIPIQVLKLGEDMLLSASKTIRFYDDHGWDIPKPEHTNSGLHPIEFDSQIEEFKRRNPLL